jgi:hypothetical protein
MVPATSDGETFFLSYSGSLRGRIRTADLLPFGRRSTHVVPPAFADVLVVLATSFGETSRIAPGRSRTARPFGLYRVVPPAFASVENAFTGDERLAGRVPLYPLSYPAIVAAGAGFEPATWGVEGHVVHAGIRREEKRAVATRDGETRSLSYVSAAGFEPASPFAIAGSGCFTRRTFLGHVVPPAFATAVRLLTRHGDEDWKDNRLSASDALPTELPALVARAGIEPATDRSHVVLPAFAVTLRFHTSVFLTISTQSRVSPLAKRAIASNTASVKPPTFMMSSRSFACVVP